MKKQVLLRWFRLLMEYLMIIPVALLIAGVTLPKDMAILFVLVLPVHMLFALYLTARLEKFRNLFVVIAGIFYVGGITWLWLQTPITASLEEISVIVFATGFSFIWGIRAGIGAHAKNLFFYTGGLVIHAISLFLIKQLPVLVPLREMAVILSIIYVIMGLPFANRRFLLDESRQKSSLKMIPLSVLNGNRTLILCILIGIILLSLWKAFIDAVVFLAEGIATIIRKIIAFIGSLYQGAKAEPERGGGQMLLPPAEESNSIIPMILNILSVLIILALLFLLIRYVVKNYKRIYRVLHDLLSGFLGRFQKWSSTEQGYFDRQESILKTATPKKKTSVFKRIFNREPKWRDMKDNASRVRFLYTRFVFENIRKGFSFSSADTPDETVARINERNRADENVHEDIRISYNQVRYGGKHPDDETVKALKDTYM